MAGIFLQRAQHCVTYVRVPTTSGRINQSLFRVAVFARMLFAGILLILLSNAASAGCTDGAADQGRIRGTVSDSANGQPIPYANVTIRGTSLGASTNSSGFYHISAVPPGTYTLMISQVGYRTKEEVVTVRENQITQHDVKLAATVIEKEEMIVVGERPVRPNEANLGMQKISTKEISMVPAGAEADIFRALQTNPGVMTTSDVSARYY
ncbi:MAG TPA: carboxypeptidase-like regulatory domain-containing protein, partial [Bacteroidota bacterium]|nr:carboxypeptidase-like regulatory domain-containing protein [Bacteroidota bacterium]